VSRDNSSDSPPKKGHNDSDWESEEPACQSCDHVIFKKDENAAVESSVGSLNIQTNVKLPHNCKGKACQQKLVNSAQNSLPIRKREHSAEHSLAAALRAQPRSSFLKSPKVGKRDHDSKGGLARLEHQELENDSEKEQQGKGAFADLFGKMTGLAVKGQGQG